MLEEISQEMVVLLFCLSMVLLGRCHGGVSPLCVVHLVVVVVVGSFCCCCSQRLLVVGAPWLSCASAT